MLQWGSERVEAWDRTRLKAVAVGQDGMKFALFREPVNVYVRKNRLMLVETVDNRSFLAFLTGDI